ncbi:MAG: ABC transporter ATP-binding protein [Clostridiales bacterium]|nr:ABC transporter ATP-binding protein [Clostridiales bacterium]
METIKFGYKYFRKSMPIAILAEILSFAGIFAELLLPILSGILIDYVINKGEVTSESGGVFKFLLSGKYGQVHSMQLFFSIAIVYSILLLLRVGLIYIRDLLQEWVGLKLETELRYLTYGKLMELDSDTISRYNSGVMLQVLNHDTIMFKELFAHRIPYLGDTIFMLITTLILISAINLSFLIIPLILMPFLIKAVMEFKKKARLNFKEIRERSAELNLTTQENIAGVRIIRSFTNEELEKEKFNTSNQNFFSSRLKQIWLSSKFELTFNTIRQISFIGTILIGAVLVIKGYMTVGFILTSSTYVLRIMHNITGLNNHIFNMQQMLIAGVELKKFMEQESKVPDSEESSLRSDTPNIEIKNVGLDIDGQQILKNINISIPYGKKIGIVGETGSGKSVLLKTLVRIRDITSGSITIDGHDIKEYSLKNLRNMYSYVFQDVFLFSNTIESNIAYSSPDINSRMVTKAATDAQAHKFIDALAERYKTIIGERGIGISGGQKQRISIARAFHKNAPIFVLDDSTSALDVNTERILLQNIYEQFSDKTVIITAHRFSSVVDCDEILYMKNGEITERGTFEELMKLGGSFARVYNIQQEQQSGDINYDKLAGAGGENHG